MDKFWEYVAYLDKPAQWFAAAVAWAPKSSLAIAVGFAVKALFF